MARPGALPNRKGKPALYINQAQHVFPACEDARLDCEKPDTSNIGPSQPIKSWRTPWRRALKDAGLNIRFHDLRHACITKLAEGQASEQTLMSIAGHLSPNMLEHYSHIRMAAKRTALDAIVQPGIDGGVAQNWHSRLLKKPLPLTRWKDWWAWVDLNYRPHPYQLSTGC